MTYETPLPTAPIYRLVVTASQLKAKQFVWVIVDDDNRGKTVQTSKATFRSLEDAYNAGRGALEYWKDKANCSAGGLSPTTTGQAASRKGRGAQGSTSSLTVQPLLARLITKVVFSRLTSRRRDWFDLHALGVRTRHLMLPPRSAASA
jgi:hypothetical protein